MYKVTLVIEDMTDCIDSSACTSINHWLDDARRWLKSRGLRIDNMKVEKVE